MKLLNQLERVLAKTRKCHDKHGLTTARKFLKSSLSLNDIGAAITDRNPKMRRAATHLLFYWGGLQALRLLARLLDSDPSPVVRHEAAFVLSTIRSTKATRLLKKSIMCDPSPIVQHESIEALGDMLGHKAERFISGFRNSNDPLIRDTVAVMLGE
jgi:HEAT repeat protein